MHRSKTNFLTLAALSVSVWSMAGLGGCSSERVASQARLQSAPSGFELIKDVSTLAKGTELYNGDGTLFGTVEEHQADYAFPTGKTEKGTKVAMFVAKDANVATPATKAADGKLPPPPVTPSVWLPDATLSGSKCVKK
jgi:hypothetical protein